MTHPRSYAFVLQAVEQISPEHLQGAVCGLADGTLTVRLTGHSSVAVCGSVQHARSQERYAVTLSAPRVCCSCPEFRFHRVPCTHAVAVALHVLRTAGPEAPRAYPVDDLEPRHGHPGRGLGVRGGPPAALRPHREEEGS